MTSIPGQKVEHLITFKFSFDKKKWMLFWMAIFKQFLQASEGTKNALIASSLLHTPFYGTSAASVTKLPVLKKCSMSHTEKNPKYLKYLPMFEEPTGIFLMYLIFIYAWVSRTYPQGFVLFYSVLFKTWHFFPH